ncbi:MAG: TetR/AcrR family transcriptional regulator [Saprospiraceae bacterium]|nr:TetR/AcrR family transcriptional regulator [Candidatus Opimibacter iunctus]
MDINLTITLNEKLYLRNPEESELGKRILEHSIILIERIGFEAFTFKKLAFEINTTEAGIYRYFENKQRLLLYLVDWYWSWQEYRLMQETRNVEQPKTKIMTAIRLLATRVEDDISTGHINEKLLHDIVMSEGAKSWLTKHVEADNKDKLFQPFKDLCALIAEFITAYNPRYAYPFSLSSTLIEMAHSQYYYMQHLPSLTDFGHHKDEDEIIRFLEQLVFGALDSQAKEK